MKTAYYNETFRDDSLRRSQAPVITSPNAGKKLVLLLWKNYMLQRRHILSTIIELALPIVLMALLISVRSATKPTPFDKPTFFKPVDIRNLPQESQPVIQKGKLPVVYSPDIPIVNDVVTTVASNLSVNITKYGFPTEEELEKYIQDHQDIDFLAGLVFINLEGNEFPKHIEYKIRLKTKVRADSNNPMAFAEGWMTQQQFPMFPRPGYRTINEFGPTPHYYNEGFLTLQHAVAMAILGSVMMTRVPEKERKTVTLPIVPKVSVKLFPIAPFQLDQFLVALQTWLPVVIMLCFLCSSINIIKNLVQEKESKIKESMKMMGLSGWLHWLSWYIKSFVVLLFSVTMMTILLKIKFFNGIGVISYTEPSLLFVFLLLYVSATISFCFAISTFFSRASSAVTASGLIYFFSYVPYMYIHPRYILMKWELKVMFCLLPNTAMAFGGQFITMFEGSGKGLNWENFTTGATPDDNMSMLAVLVMLTMDIVLYSLTTWYVDAIYPGEFGVPEPWFFPFTRSYWHKTAPVHELVLAIDEKSRSLATASFERNFEAEAIKLQIGIHIKDLTKIFGTKVAVNNISLNMYEGQITVLLGHNGAGKTTTMSMLTGLIPPSKGTAVVHGFDITRDMQYVRSSLGLCPQHDVLFKELTVIEHLKFFYKLKGGRSELMQSEVDRIVHMLSMGNRKNTLVYQLSAGLKRKLSVGIALIGGSKIVLLDEPTSGMDPAARRETWDVLQAERSGRTILLTTHFMDEADILGDRVAIMAQGQIRCCGSPLFLKKRFGTGYQMTVVKQPECDVEALTKVLHQITPRAQLARRMGAELTYILPYEDVALFPTIFQRLEDDKESLGIAGFGASMTTMEEVFFRVGELANPKYTGRRDQGIDTEYFSDDDSTAYRMRPDTPFSSVYNVRKNIVNTGCFLWLQQLRALFVKRIIHTRRNFGLLFLQLALPLIFVCIALILSKTAPKAENEPEVKLTLKLFPNTSVPYLIDLPPDSPLEKLVHYYKMQIPRKDVQRFVAPSKDKTLDDFYLRQTEKPHSNTKYEYIVGATFKHVKGSNPEIIANYNDQPYHSAPIAVSMIDAALFCYVTKDASYTITVINHPLPTTLISESYQGQSTTVGFDVAFNLVFGISLLASSFVIFLIKERETKAKHLQFISGVNFFSFWLSSFVWDFLNFMVPCLCVMGLFIIFHQTEYTSWQMQSRFLLVFIVYGWSVIPLMYLLSFMFTESPTGFTNLAIFNAFTGMGAFVTSIMLYVPNLDMSHIADVLQWFFLPLPNYCLAWAFYNLYRNYVAVTSCTGTVAAAMCESKATHPCCKDTGNCGPNGCLRYTEDYLSWDIPGIGRMLFFMAIVGTISLLMVLLVELRLFRYCENVVFKLRRLDGHKKAIDEEEDVAAERLRIEGASVAQLLDSDVVIMRNLTKYYGRFLAVNNLSIGLPRRECFGLLGTTGAGKTTVFKLLTGDSPISVGDAYLEGYSVTKNTKKVQQEIGYCPQFDAFVEQMTGRETLTMFARLRGIRERDIPSMVQALSGSLVFAEHIDKQVRDYSGGNRRKLSTAVAMIGSPSIVFLDEPTTGVDPVSRRMLWDALCKLRDCGCSITLTTHSMEECEALCTRLAIMVQGRFRCLGSPQHLKNKFGQAYTLIAKIQSSPKDYPHYKRASSVLMDDLSKLCHFIETTFPGSELKEIHFGMVNYVIKNENLSLSSIFSTMENIKQQYSIEDYSVSQTTLEDVFLNFIKEAHNV